MEYEYELLHEPDVRGPLREDVAAVTAMVSSVSRSNWVVDQEIQLGEFAWRPSAVSEDESALLHVCVTGRLPHYVQRRMEAAQAAGMSVMVAVPVEALGAVELVESLDEVDAQVFVVEQDSVLGEAESLLTAIADRNIAVEFDTRRRMIERGDGRLLSGNSYERGRRLEALLAFAFSQIEDLRVVDRNFHTATEEIDIVLEVWRGSDRAWSYVNAPYVLVESKNWKEPVDQPVVSEFRSKIRGKGGDVRLGILVGRTGFTSAARDQELRFSLDEITVVMLDRLAILRLARATDMDAELEQHVRTARLR